MYNPGLFKQEDVTVLRRWIRQYSFGILVTSSQGQLQATHLPFSATECTPAGEWKLVGHLARANAQWRAFDGESEAMVIFSGPHAYISPTLYGDPADLVPEWNYSGTGSEQRIKEPALPTWNYVAVHVYGTPRILEDRRAVLARQAATYEKDWKLGNLPSEFVARKEARVVAFEIPVARIEGKAKLGQRQQPDERHRVAAALAEHENSEAKALAAMMRDIR